MNPDEVTKWPGSERRPRDSGTGFALLADLCVRLRFDGAAWEIQLRTLLLSWLVPLTQGHFWKKAKIEWRNHGMKESRKYHSSFCFFHTKSTFSFEDLEFQRLCSFEQKLVASDCGRRAT